MTTQTTQLFAPQLLTGSAVTIYTAPTTATANSCVKRIRVRFTNTDSTARAVTAYAIQSGGSASATNTCISAESIAANGHADYDMPDLAPGGFIQAFAATASVVSITSLGGIIFS